MPLVINEALTIPDRCLEFRASRAGGPGGQNVNKVASRIELLVTLTPELGLPDDALERLRQAQRRRISKEGVLRIVGQSSRDQWQNRLDCLERLRAMILAILQRPVSRRPTRPTRGAKERRLAAKRRRSRTLGGRKIDPDAL